MINAINAANAYSSARSAVAPSGSPDGQVLGNAADDFARAMEQADQTAIRAMNGTVDTHQLVQTLAEAEMALETVVAVRDKVVEAYQEILRMPV